NRMAHALTVSLSRYISRGQLGRITNHLSLRSTMNSKLILLCLVAAIFCSQATAQYLAYGAYSPYYGYPAAYGYARYGWGYPGYVAWWGSNKAGKGPEASVGPAGPSGLTGN
ncbi:hypothetical protein PMAYCL1PPCAC_31387, partial [Pristionchus mayeri]